MRDKPPSPLTDLACLPAGTHLTKARKHPRLVRHELHRPRSRSPSFRLLHLARPPLPLSSRLPTFLVLRHVERDHVVAVAPAPPVAPSVSAARFSARGQLVFFVLQGRLGRITFGESAQDARVVRLVSGHGFAPASCLCEDPPLYRTAVQSNPAPVARKHWDK